MSQTLTSLLSPWLTFELTAEQDAQVTQLQLDSRKVTSGDVFVAIKGHAVDGRIFIDKAIELGCSAVMADADEQYPHGTIEYRKLIPVIYLDNISQFLSALAARLYHYAPMELIGITGTNGKTTISQLIAQWIDLVGKRAAVMGTTGNGFLNDLQPAINTTGNAVEIQQMLSQLHKQGADYTALEVSSHGLVQGRVKALKFSAGVFTNLSRDHLDYHGSMEEYARAKFQLFESHDCQHQIINADDTTGLQWLDKLPNAVAVSLSLFDGQHRALWANHVDYSERGIHIVLDGYWGSAQLDTALIGAFNANNVMVALATLLSLGFELEQLVAVSPKLVPVVGRMELFQSPSDSLEPSKAKIVVDYAHTPDALEKALMALRVHCTGKLWSIFGCGGDRDTGKRPMMTEISERLADESIITDDNPRGEDPTVIVSDMLKGAVKPNQIHVIHSRFDACQYALNHAEENDIILLTGKGHETYQIIGNQTVHYSDRETACELLGLTL